ncbi:MAG: homocysteine methyltransferase [Clostridiales bacterium]|nr:MAG: homocysteine methyltransferase [Clostridiales bacterium]
MIILDGALGTQIQKAGLIFKKCLEELNITNPSAVTKIHRAYVQAGSDVVYTNTFGANAYKTADCEYSVDELISAGILCAKTAVGKKTRIGLSLGPIGKLMKPNGDMSFEEAYGYFKQMVLAGKGADIIAFETFSDLLELKAAVLAAKENSDLPIYATMTFEKTGRTFTGVSVEAMAATLEGLGVDALGVNCSLAPNELSSIIKRLLKRTTLPVIIKANAGLPDPETNEYSVNPRDYLSQLRPLVRAGVSIIGGCCGTDERYISLISKEFGKTQPQFKKYKQVSILSSATKCIDIDRVCIVGERINPTGKKLFKQALIDKNISYILSQALEQTSAGADILDVNVGLPEIDEVQILKSVVEEIQSVCDLPLQLDTSDPKALEAALRIYNGKPLVNSVSGDEKTLSEILPLVKKYGASVIGLTLDKNGIPKKASERVKIAGRIIEAAEKHGIKRQDIYIDCLCLTASVQQKEAVETLKAIKTVKQKYGVKTVLGVSNVSFGLPGRVLLNSSYLTLALAHGLDLPIINPNITEMTDSVAAFNVLYNKDKGAEKFIKREAEKQQVENIPLQKKSDVKKTDETALFDAVVSGIKEECRQRTKELLKAKDALDIVNQILIPALDMVGTQFETQKIFLPQLLSSATAAQQAFDEIKKDLADKSQKSVSKGRILMATVEGDIHDIGKNIVRVVLENYGYDVVDLGRDVPAELIAETALKENIKLVGLSALMTTTVKGMERTIKLLHESGSDCKIMVGGAVLTESYAMKIGADFYSRDAKQAVDIAKKIFI